MLTRPKIEVGRCYVNDRRHILREVIEEVDPRKVKYVAFDLTSGRLLPDMFQTCFKSQIVQWADREGRPEEAARLHRYEPGPWFEHVQAQNAKATQLELTRARVLQEVEHNSLHRC